MDSKHINRDLTYLYKEVEKKLTSEEKELIHFKSVSNFIYYLIDKQEYNKNRNIKLQELGEIRMKKKIIKYLNLVINKQPAGKKESSILYDDYIYKIGDFMMQYYNFSGSGGNIKLMNILIVLTIGIVLDFFAYLFFKVTMLTLFTPALLLIAVIRMYIKHKGRRTYGVFY